MSYPMLAAALLVAQVVAVPLCASLAAQVPPPQHAEADSATRSDSAFSALQQRGAEAMGFDQYTTSHAFDALADGGSITFVAGKNDTAAVARIRKHFREIAVSFAAGDFSTPRMVHAREVPGTDVMKERRDRIRYAVTDRPGGAELRMTTADPSARAAIHAFMAFQRADHRAPGRSEH